jgi:protein phosphatase
VKVLPVPDIATLNYELPSRFIGIRVIGDVHGDFTAFLQAVNEAREQSLFVIQLGDLVDRGSDSPGCLLLAFGLRASGDGVFIKGNHDDKLQRVLAGQPVMVRGELIRTLAAIDADQDADAFRKLVLAELNATPFWLRFGQYFFVHGSFAPIMLDYRQPDDMPTRREAKKYTHLALRGETPEQIKGKAVPEDANGHPIRIYSWIDDVPPGLSVMVGHEALSTEDVVERCGSMGGRVVFCDTGCGKNGKLSWVDVMREDMCL